MPDLHSFGLVKKEKGQALLIVVLVMVVALTIGLSVASRTITNLRNTQEQASSQKALSAAEAGVEQAIKNSANVAGSLNQNTSYSTTVDQVLGTSFNLNGGNSVNKNDAIYVWLTSYSTTPANLWQNPWSGNLTVYWATAKGDCASSANPPSAIEISVISGNKTSPSTKRYAFDPCSGRTSDNHFTLANTAPVSVAGATYNYNSGSISVSNGLLMRINPLYKSTVFAVSASKALPSQGSVITSTGTTDSSATDTTTRKITVFQGYPEIPAEFFPYTLFQP